jgi:hypothetical protein
VQPCLEAETYLARKAWRGWGAEVEASLAADSAAAAHRHLCICRQVWKPWALAARTALETKAHASFVEELAGVGRRALRGWHRAARNAADAREEATRRDDLFTKVGAWWGPCTS